MLKMISKNVKKDKNICHKYTGYYLIIWNITRRIKGMT